MPKFQGNSDLFNGWDFQSQFQSSLPNTTLTQGQDLSGIYEAMTNVSAFEFRYGENFVNIGKTTGGRVANQFGIPAKFDPVSKAFKGETIGQFKEIFKLIPIEGKILDAFDRIKAGLDIGQSMANISNAMEGISAIPIIGWVVAVGVQFAEQLTGMFHFFDTAWEKEKKEVSKGAFIYDKPVDADVADTMMRAIREDDWTRIFMPAVDAPGALGNDFKQQLAVDKVEFLNTGGHGWVVRPSGGNSRRGLGVFPGVPKIMDMAQWGGGGSHYQEFQDMHPAAMQTGLLLWQLVNKNGPEMFRVDTNRLYDPWKQYFDSLEIFPADIEDLLPQTPQGMQAIHTAKRMMTVAVRTLINGAPEYTKEYVEKYFAPGCPSPLPGGWRLRDVREEFRNCGYMRAVEVPNVPEKYRTLIREAHPTVPGRVSESLTYRGIAEWKIRVLFERQKKALNTPTCAYVDGSFPAIAGSSKLRNMLHENRVKLLNRSAKMLVDVTMIPDKTYRDAMIQSHKTGGFKLSQEVKPIKRAMVNLSDVEKSSIFMPNRLALVPGPGGGATGKVGEKSSVVPLLMGAAIVLGIMSQRK